MRLNVGKEGQVTDSPELPLVENARQVEATPSTVSASVLESEKWATEKSFRERELDLKEAELQLKKNEPANSGWRSPLIVAIFAATLAAAGNAVVAVINASWQRDLEDRNAYLQRDLEDHKAEQSRILETIKAVSPDKAADNLEFLLKAGLVTDTKTVSRLRNYLDHRPPGTGAYSPVGLTTANPVSQIPPLAQTGAPIGTTFQHQFTRNDGSLNCVNEFVKTSATEWYERPSANDPSDCRVDPPNFRYTERDSDDPHYILLYDEGRSLLVHISNTQPGQSGPTAWRLITDPTWNFGGSLTRVN
jgi:hypothetical protein